MTNDNDKHQARMVEQA